MGIITKWNCRNCIDFLKRLDLKLILKDTSKIERKLSNQSKSGDTVLPNPGLVKCDPGISILPTISVFDIWSYLMSKDVPLTSIRDYRRSEAFTLTE